MLSTLTPELEDVVLQLAGLAATAVAGWLLASVIAWAFTIRRGHVQPTALERIAAPGTRRLAELLLGVSALGLVSCSTPSTTPTLTLLESASTVASTTTPPPAASAATGHPTTTVSPTTFPATSHLPTVPPPFEQPPFEQPPFEQPPFEQPPEPVDPPSSTYVVQSGDSLWTIACALLEERNGATPTSTETAVYWRELVEANRSHITSGNIDLIHPGEELVVE